MIRKPFKHAIIDTDQKHFSLAVAANEHLTPDQHLSEHCITRIVTCRKNPCLEQAKALSLVLNKPVSQIFPGEFES